MPPSRFVTGRRFFNTDRPSDFVPMAFIIYTCARYPQTQARAHNRASIDEEKFVEAENKKKKRRRRKEIEERKVKLRRGSVIERFCFCSFFFFSKYDAFYGDDDRTGWKLEWPNRGKFSRSNHCNSTTFPFFSFILSRARGKRIIGERIVFFKINQNSVPLSQSVSRCKSF